MLDPAAALADGRTDLILDLLAHGVPTDERIRGHPLIGWCAYHGDVTAVRLLLARGATLDDLGANRGLQGAAFHGHWRLCQFVLAHGADASLPQPPTGETPLHAALCKANRPVYDHIVALLLAHGADPNAPTVPGVSTGAFMRDARTRGETPLHRAAAFAEPATVQRLLDAGAVPTRLDADGQTPLAWASWHLRPPAILRLLHTGGRGPHPDNPSTYDHGRGWGTLDLVHRTRPHG